MIMTNLYRSQSLLSLLALLLLFSFSTPLTFAARKADENTRRVASPIISRVVEYSMPDEHDFIRGEITGQYSGGVPLYDDRSSHAGELMGVTFFEYQHNSSMHRQIVRGSDNSGGAGDHTIHFTWMFLESAVLVDRSPFYAFYDAVGGQKSVPIDLTPAGEYGGYMSMDVTPGNRAVVTCHNDQGVGYAIQTWWQLAPNLSFFSEPSRIPRIISNIGNTHSASTDGEVVWPAMAHQVMPGGNHVTHIIGSAFGGGNSGGSSFHYFRGENAEADGLSALWVQGWLDPTGWREIVDTIHNGEGWDITASKQSGKVAIVWINNLPDPSDPCGGGDTCSQNSSVGVSRDRWDNDLYIQTSDDFGISWNKRQNVTKKVVGTNGYRPFADLTSMYTSDDVFHVAYIAMKWEESDQGLYASRVKHWSEALGYLDGSGNPVDAWSGWPGYIRTAGVADWDPVNCDPGGFNENAAKPSIAECDNKLYVMWVELNSPKTSGNLAQDDCAARAWNNQPTGAANGDLMLAVSVDMGLTWDASRSITDSYGGANGDPDGVGACDGDVIGGGVACPAEHWPSMTAFGTDKVIDYSGLDGGDPTINNLDPVWIGTHYLDIAYIDDPDPGGAILGLGTWQQAKYRWIRIPCIDPFFDPGFSMNPIEFRYPQFVFNCEVRLVDVTIENVGNIILSYTATPIEDPGPYNGWLAIQNFGGDVCADCTDFESIGQIILNVGGSICNPGITTHLTGRVRFDHNSSRPTDYFEIDLIITDTVTRFGFDTISTTCLALTVGNEGSVGTDGWSGVSMDYPALDWKDGENLYIYDGGNIVAWTDGSDTLVNWTYGTSLADSVGLVPLGGDYKQTLGWAEHYHSGIYVTNDSSIAFEADFFAPLSPDSCNIIIKRTKVYSFDGQPHPELAVGDMVDFDIPNDSNSTYNTSGDGSDPVFSETGAQLIFLQGVNFSYDPHDTVQSNNGGWDANERYGVLVYLGGYRADGAGNISPDFPTAHGMYTASNQRFIYSNPYGFDSRELYDLMFSSGSNLSDSVGDLHVGCSYVFDYDLASDDTLYFFAAYITNLNALYPYTSKASSGIAGSVNKAVALVGGICPLEMCGPLSCCEVPGDFNGDGVVDIADVSGPNSIIGYFFQGGPGPPCSSEGDFNGDGTLDISDLTGPTSIIAYLFQGGPPPVCGPQ